MVYVTDYHPMTMMFDDDDDGGDYNVNVASHIMPKLNTLKLSFFIIYIFP